MKTPRLIQFVASSKGVKFFNKNKKGTGGASSAGDRSLCAIVGYSVRFRWGIWQEGV